MPAMAGFIINGRCSLLVTMTWIAKPDIALREYHMFRLTLWQIVVWASFDNAVPRICQVSTSRLIGVRKACAISTLSRLR